MALRVEFIIHRQSSSPTDAPQLQLVTRPSTCLGSHIDQVIFKLSRAERGKVERGMKKIENALLTTAVVVFLVVCGCAQWYIHPGLLLLMMATPVMVVVVVDIVVGGSSSSS